MDAKKLEIQKELDFHMRKAAACAAALQGIEQGDQVPHFDQIEQPAHELGKSLSRMIQSSAAREVAVKGLKDAPCPTCGQKCRVQTKPREVGSIDGTIELTETVAKCRRCRRSFFPSA